jgi:hypothetical protein
MLVGRAVGAAVAYHYLLEAFIPIGTNLGRAVCKIVSVGNIHISYLVGSGHE